MAKPTSVQHGNAHSIYVLGGGRWDVRDDIIDRPSCECLHGPAADAKPCCRSVLVLLKAVPESLRLLEGGGGSRKLSNDAPYVTFACLKAELW